MAHQEDAAALVGSFVVAHLLVVRLAFFEERADAFQRVSSRDAGASTEAVAVGIEMRGERLHIGGRDQRLDPRERFRRHAHRRDRRPTRWPNRDDGAAARPAGFTTPTSCRRTAPIGFCFEQDLACESARQRAS